MSAKSIRLCDCKGSELFWIVQIKMPFMRFLHKWQGSLAYNAILNMSGNGIVAD